MAMNHPLRDEPYLQENVRNRLVGQVSGRYNNRCLEIVEARKLSTSLTNPEDVCLMIIQTFAEGAHVSAARNNC